MHCIRQEREHDQHETEVAEPIESRHELMIQPMEPAFRRRARWMYFNRKSGVSGRRRTVENDRAKNPVNPIPANPLNPDLRNPGFRPATNTCFWNAAGTAQWLGEQRLRSNKKGMTPLSECHPFGQHAREENNAK